MEALTAFRDTFGADPSGLWSAPGRVNLIGEHTDYNGGLCLPIGLPHRTYAAAARREDDLLRVASLQRPDTVTVRPDDIGPGTPSGWAAYVAGVVWALRQDGLPIGGLDVLVDGRVPLGAGLSSSAALECAVGAAISDLFDLGLLADDTGRARLGAACDRAENDIALAPTGGMDQLASLLAREGQALLLDCRDGRTQHVPFDAKAAGWSLLVIDTKAHHALVDGQYASRRAACEAAAATLGILSLREILDPAGGPAMGLDTALAALPDEVSRRRVRHVVTEIQRVQLAVAALQEGDWEQLGRHFVDSHASLRDDYEVSCAELDLAVEAALDSGALGARMTGGGFGGSAIALVSTEAVTRVSDAVASAFARAGFTAPDCFPVHAAPGARREPGSATIEGGFTRGSGAPRANPTE